MTWLKLGLSIMTYHKYITNFIECTDKIDSRILQRHEKMIQTNELKARMFIKEATYFCQGHV